MMIKLFAITASKTNRLSLRPVSPEVNLIPIATHGCPPDSAKEFSHEVAAFVVAHYKRFEQISDSCGQARDEDSDSDADEVDWQRVLSCPGRVKDIKNRSLREIVDAMVGLLRVCNGRWWEAHIEHFCAGCQCCANREDTQARICQALRQTLFRRMPPTPAINKWTKLAPVCDMLVFGAMLHNIFAKTFFGLDIPMAGEIDSTIDFDMIKDAFFSAVSGSRFRASKDFLQDANTRPALVTLSLILEPLRVLTSWWMRRAREVDPHSGQRPLMDILCPSTSVLTATLQYLSSLLHGQPKRLLMLWRPSGAASFQEWFRTHPSEVQQFRRLVLLTSAAIFRRHAHCLRQFPWLFVSLVDDRLAPQEKEHIAAAFDDLHPCCLPSGFARKLKETGVTSAQLMARSDVQELFTWFSRLVRMQIADVEWRHHRNRARSHSHGQTRWATFSASYVNGEMKSMQDRHRLNGY
jgi:hypothetical protein